MNSRLGLVPVVALMLMAGCASRHAPPPSAAARGVADLESHIDRHTDALWQSMQRTLPGTWVLATPKSDAERAFHITYASYSRQSVILETWGAGGARPTITTLAPNGGNLVLVHYCAQGNQPRLRLTSADSREAVFAQFDVTNLQPDQSMMIRRALTISEDGQRVRWIETYRAPSGQTEVTTYELVKSAE